MLLDMTDIFPLNSQSTDRKYIFAYIQMLNIQDHKLDFEQGCKNNEFYSTDRNWLDNCLSTLLTNNEQKKVEASQI